MIKEIINSKQGESAVIAIDEIICEVFQNDPKSLTEEEFNFFLVEVLEKEINSGGFNKYFYYESGNYVFETIQALDELGSVYFLRILKEALDVFDGAYTKDEIERSNVIDDKEDEFNPIWDKLDNEFYKYEENIHQLLLDFVTENIHSFR